MDKKNFKDAYDIGENMAALSGEGRSYTIINKETGKTRQLVSEDGTLLVADNEIDFDAINKGCPDFNGCKWVRYWFGRYDNFINKDLEIIVPFQPMDDVKEMLKKFEK